MSATLTDQQLFRRQVSGEPLFQDQIPRDSQQHVITVSAERSIGALNRVINLFSQRGFDLNSVTVGQTNEDDVVRMTLVTTGNDRVVAQVVRQLDNLIDTLNVEDVSSCAHVERELCLITVAAEPEDRIALNTILDVFRGSVVNITHDSMMFEVSGPPEKISAFITLMNEYTVLEVARSGRIAMRRQLVFENPTKSSHTNEGGDL